MCTFGDMGNIPCLAKEGLWSLTVLVATSCGKKGTRGFLFFLPHGLPKLCVAPKNQRWGIPLDCGGVQASGQTCSKDMCTVFVSFFWCSFCAFLSFCSTGKANFVKPPLGYYYYYLLIQRADLLPVLSKKKGTWNMYLLIELIAKPLKSIQNYFLYCTRRLPYLVPY